MQATAPDQIVDARFPADSQEPDESLMLRYVGGDVEAFETLFHRHKKRVYSFIRRFLGCGSHADDLFQEVFLRLARVRKGYRPRARFTTWLYTITRSVCIDAMRKERRHAGTVPIQPEEPECAVERLHVIPPNPRDHAVQEEIQTALDRLIDQLPKEQREVLLMREKLNLPFNEIARLTGCAVGTAKSRMRYALDTLRKEFIAEGLVQ